MEPLLTALVVVGSASEPESQDPAVFVSSLSYVTKHPRLSDLKPPHTIPAFNFMDQEFG